jgi:hypothetical protein
MNSKEPEDRPTVAVAENCLVFGRELHNDVSNSILLGCGDAYIHLLPDNTIVIGPAFSTELIRAAIVGPLSQRVQEEPSDLLVLAGKEPKVVFGPSMVFPREQP